MFLKISAKTTLKSCNRLVGEMPWPLECHCLWPCYYHYSSWNFSNPAPSRLSEIYKYISKYIRLKKIFRGLYFSPLEFGPFLWYIKHIYMPQCQSSLRQKGLERPTIFLVMRWSPEVGIYVKEGFQEKKRKKTRFRPRKKKESTFSTKKKSKIQGKIKEDTILTKKTEKHDID